MTAGGSSSDDNIVLVRRVVEDRRKHYSSKTNPARGLKPAPAPPKKDHDATKDQGGFTGSGKKKDKTRPKSVWKQMLCC